MTECHHVATSFHGVQGHKTWNSICYGSFIVPNCRACSRYNEPNHVIPTSIAYEITSWHSRAVKIYSHIFQTIDQEIGEFWPQLDSLIHGNDLEDASRFTVYVNIDKST